MVSFVWERETRNVQTSDNLRELFVVGESQRTIIPPERQDRIKLIWKADLVRL